MFRLFDSARNVGFESDSGHIKSYKQDKETTVSVMFQR